MHVSKPEEISGSSSISSGKNSRQARIFDIALASMLDFVYVFDLDGRFVFVNKPLLDLWGLTLAEAVGKNFFDLKYPAELAAKLQRQIQQVIDTRQPLSDETPYTSPTGAGGYYEYVFSPIFADNGALEAVAGCTRVITARRRAETLLEAQRAALELVADDKPLAEILAYLTRIVEDQSDGQSIAGILLLDDQGRLRIGAAPLLPDDYNNAIDGLKASADLGTCSAAAATGQTVITPDIAADPKWISIKHLPAALGLKAAWSKPILSRTGRVLGTFGTYFRECRAPTAHERQVVELLARTAAIAIERRTADAERERLLASEKSARAEADAANRAKDKFIAVLSHELRTPLSPIVMAVTSIERDPDLPAKFREDIAMIRRNAELESKLIDDLLDLSRITSAKLRLDLQPVRVHDVLRDAIRNSINEIPGKHVEIREQLAAKNDCISADPARLQQIFWNLVRNSVKFSADAGVITVRTFNPPDSPHLVIEVADDGAGIAPELLPRIFNAFEQGDARAARQFGGLGLGLAIAKAVVEMHGGAISAASPGPDRGATFTTRFTTLASNPASASNCPPAPAAPRPAGSRANILLVEDHPDTARVLARILRGFSYHVEIAHTVAAALELADAHTFDIVLSDIGLPDATGYELMEQLRDRHGAKGIALTGYGMEDDIRRARAAGFVDHVVKPVNIDHLQSIIDRLTARPA